ncbi:adenylyltransferase/cytidyltransferase family protein [Candidatus Woesearchaeota archaeon]|nr:adenylyltransferase/cytidyltransferase family protein [Candidatus Woesearchaeota archaeon]
MNKKIITREESAILAEEFRKEGNKIVTINGSYDILHAGHLSMLKEAKNQGDILIVGLNSDESVRAWKKRFGHKDWEKRPLIPQQYRAEMLTALEYIDYITIFDEPDCISFIEAIKPDIHVNGPEYGEDCIEKSVVEKYGGRLHIAQFIEGLSTSKLIQKIIEIYSKKD